MRKSAVKDRDNPPGQIVHPDAQAWIETMAYKPSIPEGATQVLPTAELRLQRLLQDLEQHAIALDRGLDFLASNEWHIKQIRKIISENT